MNWLKGMKCYRLKQGAVLFGGAICTLFAEIADAGVQTYVTLPPPIARRLDNRDVDVRLRELEVVRDKSSGNYQALYSAFNGQDCTVKAEIGSAGWRKRRTALSALLAAHVELERSVLDEIGYLSDEYTHLSEADRSDLELVLNALYADVAGIDYRLKQVMASPCAK